MPFITKEQRNSVDKDVRFAEEPGDLCYYFYAKFMEGWKAERRWKTAHNLYKKYLLQNDHLISVKGVKFTQGDVITALHLAWQVFFVKHVMVYEEEKIEENGDIE